MWKLNIEDDQENRTTVNLVRDEYSIGRDVENAVRLTERNISRKHAALKRADDDWSVQDLQSYNGCFVNGKRVTGDATLNHGDLVQLGDYRLEILDESLSVGGNETVPVKRMSQTLREQPDRLVMIAGPAVGVPFSLLEKRVVIGRGEECDLAINDTSVSRVHAEIVSLGDGTYEVLDRESSNGVRVNGVDLKRTMLDPGDVVELGDVQLKFVKAGEIYHPEPAPAGARGHTLEPGVGATLPMGSANTGKVIAGVGIAAALAIVAIVATRSGDKPKSATAQEVSQTAQPNPAAEALAEAKELLDKGDVEGAVQRTQDIPMDSNLRESTIFKEVHARWADDIFEQAAGESDKSRKRALLDLISKSPDVSSVRRKRAANEIASLDADSVDISDLPTAAKKKVRRQPSAAQAPKAPAPTGAAPTPAGGGTPVQPANPKGGLIRETPF